MNNRNGKTPNPNLKPAPQLDPDEIALRLNRGAILLRAASKEEYDDLVDSYRLGSGAPTDYQNAARMYWVRERFDKELVKILPWSIILELSRPTKPLDVREMLSDLCMWWCEARREERTPSPYAFPPEKSLILGIVDHPDIYREDLSILHAKAKYHRNLPISEREDALICRPTPDLINRVRTDRSIVISKAVERAIQEVASAAIGNGVIGLESLNHLDQTGTKVQETLSELKDFLTSLKADDNTVIITSLRSHANNLERQLANALQVNEDLQFETNSLRIEIMRLNGVDDENRRLREQLADIKLGIDLLVEKFTNGSQAVMVIDSENIVEPASV